MELFNIGFLHVTWIDLLDIALVSFIFYKLYMVMRGTIAAQIFVGLVLILVFSIISQAINFKAMNWILRTLTDIWVIAFIILFQPELRRLLVLLGRNPLVRMFLRLNAEESIDEISGAAAELAKKHHGMLIVIVRATGLRTLVESGQSLQARISKPLLVSIFNPRSPLHDGAVVVRDRVMERLDRVWPVYGFAQHKGYGTADHMEAIRTHGPCPMHRRTFAPVSTLELPLV